MVNYYRKQIAGSPQTLKHKHYTRAYINPFVELIVCPIIDS